MKNIHVLPTDKPSRLHKTVDKGLFYLKTNYNTSSRWFNQNIYITSDEEIKEGNWFIGLKNQMSRATSKDIYGGYERKIILTTDQDLIKDGVQAIEDEFLEWFVNNPSCEEIELANSLVRINSFNWITDYKIIIPKEEPKQETLEEVSERYANMQEDVSETIGKYLVKAVFKDGAYWNQERSYNEIKELYDNENITGFSKLAYAKCLDIIKNK